MVSYGELYERALGILFHLQKLGAKPGDKLIIYLANNEQFLDAFWAGMLGGIVPVPVALGISDEHKHKLLRIAKKLGKPFIYTDRKTLDRIGAFAGPAGEQAAFDGLHLARVLRRTGRRHLEGRQGARRSKPMTWPSSSSPRAPPASPRASCSRTGTSSSTRAARVRRRNWNENDINLTWMPLTHDMGLIGMHIMMFAHRMQLQRHADGAVHPPSAAVDDVLPRASAPRSRARRTSATGTTSRCWAIATSAISTCRRVRLIYNGAEPISVELADEFMTRLAPAKLKRTAMYPVYGLAEATLVVSFPQPPGADVRIRRRQSPRAQRRQAARRRCPRTMPDALSIMAVGQPVPFTKVRIADDDDQELPENHIGHILISGDNVTKGYFENPEANAKGFTAPDSNDNRWLRTGDLGMMKGGKLFITGRAKEIIFVNGQNYYPHDIESIAIRAEGLELGKVVAAGVRPKGASTDDLILFVLHRMDMKEFLPLATQVTRLVNEHTGLEVAHVVPVKRIPKTTSGKIQRHLLEEDYVNGVYAAELAELDAPARGGRSRRRREG